MSRDTLFVFDIETIPDTNVVYNLTGEKSDDLAVQREALRQYHLALTDGKNDFPRQPFWQVVAISFVQAKIERSGRFETYHLQEVRTGGEEDTPEPEMIKGVFQYLERLQPRFVSFNGRNFDMPVLKFRAMKYGVSAGWLYQSGDKWNNYHSRYSPDWHCDLIDALKDYGAMSGGLKLNEVCALLNLPGKLGIDGSKVTELYDSGNIKDIRDYCETDVLNTYMVYLHYQHLNGMLSDEGLEQALDDIKIYLDKEGKTRHHLAEFAHAWEETQKS